MSNMSREELMNAFGSRLLELLNLAHVGQHGAALSVLDEIEAEHHSADVEGWLHRSVLSTRGLILQEMGDVDAARRSYRAAARACSDASDWSEFLVNQLALARLAAEPDEAIRELEVGLDRAEGLAAPTSLGLLRFYAEVAATTGDSVPLRYESLFRAACMARKQVPQEYAQGDEKAFTKAILSAAHIPTPDITDAPMGDA